MKKRISQLGQYPSQTRESKAGFTLIEISIVVVIVLVVGAIVVPNIVSFIHGAKLQGAGSDFAGLLQQDRIRAVQDDSYYATYIVTSGALHVAYVDLLANGGTGGAHPASPIPNYDQLDPDTPRHRCATHNP